MTNGEKEPRENQENLEAAEIKVEPLLSSEQMKELEDKASEAREGEKPAIKDGQIDALKEKVES